MKRAKVINGNNRSKNGGLRFFILGVWLTLVFPLAAQVRADRNHPAVGSERAIYQHLKDDEEFRLPLVDLLAHGKKIFSANWTEEDGAGRPLTKGTGRGLSDPTKPLVGERSFNRVSGPDANSCAGCHNAPYGITGGGGDFVTNVFVLAQRFDFVTLDARDPVPTGGALSEDLKPATLLTVGNQRATTGMFGAGYLEMLARQITADLQKVRDSLELGQTKPLLSKGIRFGSITRQKDGLWDTSKVDGLPRASLVSNGSIDPPSLIVRPWHQAGNVTSLREFTNNAFNQHHGMQATERFGLQTDADGDGIKDELTRADVTAVTAYQAVLDVPGRVIPSNPEIEQAVLLGEALFERIGCSICHISRLPLDAQGWIYTEPNPYNPPGNLRLGETRSISIDLTSDVLPGPRLKPNGDGVLYVAAYTDFKLHDICEENDPGIEPLDMNQTTWSPKFKQGNRKFLTKRLWGAANEPPFFHHGLFTTLRRAVLAHGGEARDSKQAFERLLKHEQDAVIEFLKTLQVLPPGTKELVVDEHYRRKEWPPKARPATLR